MGGFGGEGSSTAKLDKLVERMERDQFDLIAVGRALIADPAWGEKVRTGNSSGLQDFDAAPLGELVQGLGVTSTGSNQADWDAERSGSGRQSGDLVL